MQSIDIFIIIPLLYGAYKGYKRGIVIEIISIVAFVGAVVISFKFLAEASNYLGQYLEGSFKKILPYVSFAVVFFPIIFLVNKMGWWLRSATKTTILGNFDTIIGAFVGLLTWAFGISLVFWLVGKIGLYDISKLTQDSEVYPIIAPIAPILVNKATETYKQTNFEKWKPE